MSPYDSKDPFLRIPWTASLLSRPNIVIRIPGSRLSKASNEDSLYATTLKTPSTISSCISAYEKPRGEDSQIAEVSTFATLGSGMDGHPGILHGGIVAALIDEGMGVLQTANHERNQQAKVRDGRFFPDAGLGSFTAYLNVKYLRPVRTGSVVVVVAKYVKREGRKDFIDAEVKQAEGDDDGEVVICAKAEGLFIVPREKKL